MKNALSRRDKEFAFLDAWSHVHEFCATWNGRTVDFADVDALLGLLRRAEDAARAIGADSCACAARRTAEGIVDLLDREARREAAS